VTKFYTTKSGARVLGVKQDTLKHYALRFNIGSQPGGPGTPWVFTPEEILEIRNRAFPNSYKWEKVEREEDRDELGLGPLYNPDASPRS